MKRHNPALEIPKELGLVWIFLLFVAIVAVSLDPHFRRPWTAVDELHRIQTEAPWHGNPGGWDAINRHPNPCATIYRKKNNYQFRSECKMKPARERMYLYDN